MGIAATIFIVLGVVFMAPTSVLEVFTEGFRTSGILSAEVGGSTLVVVGSVLFILAIIGTIPSAFVPLGIKLDLADDKFEELVVAMQEQFEEDWDTYEVLRDYVIKACSDEKHVRRRWSVHEGELFERGLGNKGQAQIQRDSSTKARGSRLISEESAASADTGSTRLGNLEGVEGHEENAAVRAKSGSQEGRGRPPRVTHHFRFKGKRYAIQDAPYDSESQLEILTNRLSRALQNDSDLYIGIASPANKRRSISLHLRRELGSDRVKILDAPSAYEIELHHIESLDHYREEMSNMSRM